MLEHLGVWDVVEPAGFLSDESFLEVQSLRQEELSCGRYMVRVQEALTLCQQSVQCQRFWPSSKAGSTTCLLDEMQDIYADLLSYLLYRRIKMTYSKVTNVRVWKNVRQGSPWFPGNSRRS